MLPREKVQEIKDLLATGDYSQREISLRAGVSRGSVAAIAKGKRRFPTSSEIYEGEAEPRRCPVCGAMVLMPCRACFVRRYREQILARRRARHRARLSPRSVPERRPAA